MPRSPKAIVFGRGDNVEIAFLSQIVPYPPHGGVLQRGFNLIRELGKYNRVHLYAFRHGDTLPTPESVAESLGELKKYCATVEYVDLWPKKSRLHYYSCLGLGFFSRSPFSVLAHMSRAFGEKLRWMIANRRVDIIHVDTIALAQFSDLGAGIPRVLTHHNIESKLMARRAQHESSLPQRFYADLQARRLAAYERRHCPQFGLNIFVSELDAAEMEKKVPGLRTAIIPNGVDIDYFRPAESVPDHPTMIYTGGMNMFANKEAVLYFLREIWPNIVREIPESIFYAVGQDPPGELRDLAARDRRIRVTGFVDDVRPLISQSSVYVVPLRVGGGTRLKILDAMAMGKAIVSTSVGCEGIEVSPGRNIMVADDAGAFARAVIALIRDREKRMCLGRDARALVERNYSWEEIGRKLQSEYEEVTRRGRGSRGLNSATRTTFK